MKTQKQNQNKSSFDRNGTIRSESTGILLLFVDPMMDVYLSYFMCHGGFRV